MTDNLRRVAVAAEALRINIREQRAVGVGALAIRFMEAIDDLSDDEYEVWMAHWDGRPPTVLA